MASKWAQVPLAPPRLGLVALLFLRSSQRSRSWRGLRTKSLCPGAPPPLPAWWQPAPRGSPSLCVALSSGIIFPDLTTASVCCGFTALKMFSNNPQVFLSHTIAWLVTTQLNPYLRHLIKTLNGTSHKACSLPASCQKCLSLPPPPPLSQAACRWYWQLPVFVLVEGGTQFPVGEQGGDVGGL